MDLPKELVENYAHFFGVRMFSDKCLDSTRKNNQLDCGEIVVIYGLDVVFHSRAYVINRESNVEVSGLRGFSRRSARLPGWGSGDQNPLFELRGPDGAVWMLYEDGRATGFPDGTVIVNRAKPQLDLLRGRIKKFEAALISDQQ
ncbi:hypothetical protein [Thiobacillus sp. 65-1402]|uniref:hypothetical protein n=1 Tax=Thiobacillus sp. 65-1402 TaxID=1895861 RepID=UPI0009603AAF|nr:hypothetical protein [Thiobacillus sp. 65-1402]OJW95509.1 MAG: hypothetical protein BGO62_08715 [Thiobacillus sp. 65-1402]